MTAPHLQVTSITITAAHPRTLAGFYSRLLGWPIAQEDPPAADGPEDGGWTQLRPSGGETAPRLNFERDRRFRSPVWPSVDGEQTATQHLDIHVDDLEAAVAWAVEQGAVVDAFQPQGSVRVMRDPEGHPFCLYI